MNRSDEERGRTRPPASSPRLPEVDDFPETGVNALASFSQRVTGRIIDELVLLVPFLVVAGFYLTTQFEGDPPSDFTFPIWVTFASCAVAAAYEITLIAVFGQTLGKRICGVRVARYSDGKGPTVAQAALRCLLPLVAGAASLLTANLSWGSFVVLGSSFFDPLRRGWHDKAGGTIVIRTR